MYSRVKKFYLSHIKPINFCGTTIDKSTIANQRRFLFFQIIQCGYETLQDVKPVMQNQIPKNIKLAAKLITSL